MYSLGAKFKKGLKICEKTGDSNECREIVSSAIATSNRNIGLCKSLSENYKNNCMVQIAEETGNVEICEEFKETHDEAKCVMNVAIARKDKQLCEKLSNIQDEEAKDTCLKYFDVANKTGFFCDVDNVICRYAIENFNETKEL